MHRVFKVSNLAKLPFSIRAGALTAASGSSDERFKFLSRCAEQTIQLTTQQWTLMLPLFFSILDPDIIQSAGDQLETESGQGDVYQSLLAALSTFNTLSHLISYEAIPQRALPELWARLFPWMEFLDAYEDFAELSFTWLNIKAHSYAHFLRFFGSNTENKPAIRSSLSRVAFVVGRTWSHLIEMSPRGSQNLDALFHLSQWLYIWAADDAWDLAIAEDLVAGAGGMSALATLIVSHVRAFLPTPASPRDRHTFDPIFDILIFVGTLYEILPNFPLSRALLNRGIVTALMDAFRALLDGTLHDDKGDVGGFANFIQVQLSSYPRHKWTGKFLQAGLIPAICASAATPHMEEPALLTFGIILNELLPLMTIYHSVLSDLRPAFETLSRLDASPFFAEQKDLEHWNFVFKMIEYRLRIHQLYTDGNLNFCLACGNVKCAAPMSTTHKLRRCGGCSFSLYCSKECQVQDWRFGHRHACALLSTRRHDYSHLSDKDRSFLRHLIFEDGRAWHDEVSHHRQDIVLKLPAAIPYILFDYTDQNSYRAYKVGLLDELDSGFDDDAVRAICRSGRMQFQLVRVWQGNQAVTWLFPMNSVSTCVSRRTASQRES
ncbi:hypothetical protein R3P38DRAFT_3285563 [Favolaschia claudopus]|uniref:MYND-type domain-containing protein n=1 Tax=Favolaschia claudopus TaxID=2862362 RepID=A0AAW0A2J0_9AGAR